MGSLSIWHWLILLAIFGSPFVLYLLFASGSRTKLRKWLVLCLSVPLAFTALILGFPIIEMILVGDGEKTKNGVPKMGSVSHIVVNLRPSDGGNFTYRITDAKAIADILAAYEAVESRWHTQGGHFTTPVARNMAIFCAANSGAEYMLWFDEYLLRSRQFVGDSSVDAYHDGDSALLKLFLEASSNLSPAPGDSRCAA